MKIGAYIMIAGENGIRDIESFCVDCVNSDEIDKYIEGNYDPDEFGDYPVWEYWEDMENDISYCNRCHIEITGK